MPKLTVDNFNFFFCYDFRTHFKMFAICIRMYRIGIVIITLIYLGLCDC